MKFSSFLAGVFCGAIVGGVAALLLTPSSGEELQLQARGRFDRVLEEARAAVEDRRMQLEAQLEGLKLPKKSEE